MLTVKGNLSVRNMASLASRVCTLTSSPVPLTHARYLALKWFDADGNHEPYESGRDLDSLAAL